MIAKLPIHRPSALPEKCWLRSGNTHRPRSCMLASGRKAAFLAKFTSNPKTTQQLWRTSMHFARRPLRRALLFIGLCASLCLPALAADRPRVKAEDYVIDAEMVPKTHRLTARAKVKFTALEDTNFASFELNNGLRITKVLDEKGKPLTAERVTQDNAVRISFPTTLSKGSSSTLTFDYEGPLANADDSP